MIRVFVVEPAPLTCVLIVATLKNQPGIEVVGFAPHFDESHLAQLEDCDVVLINTTLSGTESLRSVQFLTGRAPKIKSVVMGLPASKDVISAYLKAGAAGYVLEQEAVEVLPDYIKTLVAS
jgi:DNA-binding NarL/FixJ family response regulator